MPKKRIPNFNYCMVTIKGHQYYKAYVQNADEKTVIVYGKTIEENQFAAIWCYSSFSGQFYLKRVSINDLSDTAKIIANTLFFSGAHS